MKMKTTLQVAHRATSRTLKIAFQKFLEQFESPSTRNYRRLKDFLSNG
jgi:plasmid replication initiation protein